MTDWFIWKNFWDLTIQGLELGAIYALIALGYTLVYGVLRLINFAHSEVFMIGTFGALFAMQWMGLEPSDASRTGVALVAFLLVGVTVAMAFSGGTAVALERVAYRPLRKRNAPRLAALISAIGASIAMSEAFALWRGRDLERFPSPLSSSELFTFFDGRVTTEWVIIVVSAVGMMIALDQFIGRTRLGRGIRAVAQDGETAAILGVNRDRVIMITFLLGGIMAGGAAFLFMLKYEVTKYNIGFLLGVKAFTAAVLGGIGNLRGALLGGLLLGVIENYGSALIGTQWRDVIAFVVLVVVLMFRPTGLLGESLGRARV